MPFSSRSSTLNQYSMLVSVVLSSSASTNPTRTSRQSFSRLTCSLSLTCEVIVPHLGGITCLELPRHLREDTIDCLPRQRMAGVLAEFLFRYDKIVVLIQLPELAVQHVKVLIREVLTHLFRVIKALHP